MFCKWCGADMPNAAKKCTRCGKEPPAKSECGGFYNLYTPPKAPVPEQMPANPSPLIVSMGRPRKKNNAWLSLTCAVLAVVVIVLSVLLLTNKPDSTGKEQEPPKKARLEEQTVAVDVTVENATAKVSADFGDCDVKTNSKVSFDPESLALTQVQLDLEETENAIEVTTKTNHSLFDKSITLRAMVSVDEAVFGEAKELEYVWSYRLEGEEEWKPLEEAGIFNQKKQSTISYSQEDLQELLGENASFVEFQLTCIRTGKDGGSVTLGISGIAITAAKDQD